MKLVIAFLFVGFLQVSAKSYSQKISIDAKDLALEKVFKSIESQSDFVFFYDQEGLKKSHPVTISVKNINITDALDACLKDQPLVYNIVGKTIVVNLKEPEKDQPIILVTPPVIENIAVKGKVVDEQGLPVTGVSVVLKGTAIGVGTDENGNFMINIPENSSKVLVFSCVGKEQQEVRVTGNEQLTIVLKSNDASLQDIVVVGYGTVKRSDLTGSVSSVTSEKITQVKGVSTIAQALQGQAAGVQVFQRSGQPGEGVSIKIRGTNSIQAGNDVLYVVDGMPLDGLTAQLNPSDIESMEILKDASSTAIYGSRGANGVVMITTKKGKEGKIRISYNGYYGVQMLRKKIDVIGARDYTTLYNEARANWNADNPTLPQLTLLSSSEIENLVANSTDWQDLVYQNALMQNHDISFMGGSAATKYYMSVGYFNQEGIIPNSGYRRLSFRSNLDQKFTERLSLFVSLSLLQSNYKQNNYFNADGNGGVPFTTMVMPPTQGVYDATGKYTIFTGVPWGQTNPYGLSKEEYRANPSLRLLGNAVLSYSIARGLKLKLSAGVDNSWSRSDYFAPSTLSIYNGGGASQSYSNSYTFVNENILNYNRTFNNHSIDAVGGITYQYGRGQNLNSGTAQGFSTDIYLNNNINAASVKAIPSNGYIDNTLLSYLGRVNYTYAGKYLLTVTGRYDGSSRFSANHKYAFFPSGAVGWRVSEERFMQNIPEISNLKLRASYGLSGNQAISSYQTLASLGNSNVILNNVQVVGYNLSRLPYDNLKWETTKQFDIGFDLGLFHNRIELTADYYNKRTSDLLLNVSLPTNTGFTSSLQNVGVVGNKGYEFQLNTKNLTGKLAWNSTLTFSHNKTKVLDLGKDAQGNPITYKEVGVGGNWFPIILGQSMMQLFGYKVLGVYQTDAEAVANGEPTKKAGDYKFQTTPGGILPNDGRMILSHFEPKFTFGFNNNFTYENWGLSFLIAGSYGNDIANEFRKYNLSLNGKWAPTKEFFDGRWQPGKTDATGERPQWDRAGSSIRDYANSQWIEDGSYLKVRDITLSYNFSSKMLKSIRISGLQLYLSGQNLITLTKYSGYDPEAQWSVATILGWDRGNYPGTKSVTGGLKLNF